MDEIKTNPPVETAPVAAPPKKVRRVGTLSFALLLIGGGVLLLAQQFMPDTDLVGLLRFSPIILIILGIEVLVYSTKLNVKLKFDWLGVLGCAFILVVIGTASLLPLAWRYFGPSETMASESIAQQTVDALYTELAADPALKAKVSAAHAVVDFNHFSEGDYTLQPGDTLNLYVTFQAGEPDVTAFAADCAAVTRAAEAANLGITNYSFSTEDQESGAYNTYTLDYIASFAQGLNADQLAQRARVSYWYNEYNYDTEADRDNAIKADLADKINEQYADEHDGEYPGRDYLEAETQRQFNEQYGTGETIATPESAAQ